MVSITERAKAAIARITSNANGAGDPFTLIKLDDTSYDLIGTGTTHHLAIDQMTGNTFNSKTSSVSFSEQIAKAAGCVIRNAKNEVDMTGWKVNKVDSAGIARKYIMQKWFPDEKLGLIVCILEDYEQD